MLEALESGRAYSSLSLSSGGTQEDGEELDPLESIGTEEHQYEVSEDRAVLAPGFRVLDERERKILHLRFFEGLTQSQIAQQIGISQMHVSRLIRRSLEKIRDEIAAEEEIPAPARRCADRARHGPRRADRPDERRGTDPYNRARARLSRDPRGIPLLLRVEGPPAQPSASLIPRAGRPVDAADQRGDAAADAVLPRPRAAAGAADDDRAEVLPHARHRRGRARHVPPARSSRCSATSRSASTSRRARSSSRPSSSAST